MRLRTMKALVRDGYGSIEVLHLRDIDVPVPKENEVLVRVHATSINDFDLFVLQPFLVFRLIDRSYVRSGPAHRQRSGSLGVTSPGL